MHNMYPWFLTNSHSHSLYCLETFKWRKEFGVDTITYESLNQESQIIGLKSFWPEVKKEPFFLKFEKNQKKNVTTKLGAT